MVALRRPATAAVATDEEEGENYHQGQPQDHGQADGVEDTSFMSGLDGFPDRVEEGTVSIHDAGLAWGQRIPIISQALGFTERSASHWEFIFPFSFTFGHATRSTFGSAGRLPAGGTAGSVPVLSEVTWAPG